MQATVLVQGKNRSFTQDLKNKTYLLNGKQPDTFEVAITHLCTVAVIELHYHTMCEM